MELKTPISQDAAAVIIAATPIACARINTFSQQTLTTRGGRTGSGLGTLLEALWGFYINQVLIEQEATSLFELGWMPGNAYNDFACVRVGDAWNSDTRSGELLRVEAKSMNTDVEESKGHFDALKARLGVKDLLMVLAWSWRAVPGQPDATIGRVYPHISDQFIGSARSIAELRDQLHIARGGAFVTSGGCPDGCAPDQCTHIGEPLNAAGKRERSSGPITCKPAGSSYAANFGGLVRMIKTSNKKEQRAKALKVLQEVCSADPVASAYVAFVRKNFQRAVVADEQRGNDEISAS